MANKKEIDKTKKKVARKVKKEAKKAVRSHPKQVLVAVNIIVYFCKMKKEAIL